MCLLLSVPQNYLNLLFSPSNPIKPAKTIFNLCFTFTVHDPADSETVLLVCFPQKPILNFSGQISQSENPFPLHTFTPFSLKWMLFQLLSAILRAYLNRKLKRTQCLRLNPLPCLRNSLKIVSVGNAILASRSEGSSDPRLEWKIRNCTEKTKTKTKQYPKISIIIHSYNQLACIFQTFLHRVLCLVYLEATAGC